MNLNSRANIWHKWSRNFAIFCTVVLSTVFQAHIIVREEREWDPFSNGYCYLNHDQSSPKAAWLWVAGLSLYSMYLLVYLTSIPYLKATGLEVTEENIWTDKLTVWLNGKLKKWRKNYLRVWHKLLFKKPDREGMVCKHTQTDYRLNWPIGYPLEFVSYIPIILAWLLFEFLALCAYGNSQSVLLVMAYFWMAGWNTYDIVDAKNSNRDLIEGSEDEWRFGQVVPLVLLALIVLLTFDAAESKSMKTNAANNSPTYPY
jgi:hypothetical protein